MTSASLATLLMTSFFALLLWSVGDGSSLESSESMLVGDFRKKKVRNAPSKPGSLNNLKLS